MNGPQKVYVIKTNKSKAHVDLDLPPGNVASSGAMGSEGSSSAARDGTRSSDRRSGALLLLLYCTGPFAILATSRGRKSRPWVLAAVLSVLVGLVTLSQWNAFVSATDSGSREAVITLVAACVSIVGIFAVWARGVFLIGRQEGARVRRIPEILKRPAGTGILGAVMPGLGLLISGRSRRAAAVLWMVCMTLVSALILSQADWLWRFNSQAGALATEGRTLEYLFVALAACALLGAVSWLAQALDGMHNAAKGNGRVAAMRAGAAITILFASFVVAGLALEGRDLAAGCDDAAGIMHEEGLEVVPLILAEAAMRLDPSLPAYTARAIALHEAAGNDGTALVLRRSLVDRLEPCIGMLEQEGLVLRAEPAPGPSPAPVERSAAPAVRLLPAELLISPQAQMPFGP